MDYGLAKHVLMGAGELYSETSDHRKIFTPFKLAKEILDQMELKGNILTFNMEFIFVLKERGLINNVWFATVCDMQERAMIAVGIDKSRIIRYAYNKLDEFPEMKFDVVIANPPYEKYKYVDFIRLGISLTKKGGWIGMITPRWSMFFASKWNHLRNIIFSNIDVKLIKHPSIKSFKTIKNDKLKHILTPTHFFIGKVGGRTTTLKVLKQWKNKTYSTNITLNNVEDPIPGFIGDKGVELFKSMLNLDLADLSLEIHRARPNIPVVFAGVRHRAHLWGTATNTTGKLISGDVLDLNGTKSNPYRGVGNKQPVWYCKNQIHAINMQLWLHSNAMKIHISQVDGSSKFLNGVVKYYPDCPITDRIATEQEMYEAAGFNNELIQWINEQ